MTPPPSTRSVLLFGCLALGARAANATEANRTCGMVTCAPGYTRKNEKAVCQDGLCLHRQCCVAEKLTCIDGWKAPSACARTFTHQGRRHSGCKIDSGTAWCAHDAKYVSGRWSPCRPCAPSQRNLATTFDGGISLRGSYFQVDVLTASITLTSLTSTFGGAGSDPVIYVREGALGNSPGTSGWRPVPIYRVFNESAPSIVVTWCLLEHGSHTFLVADAGHTFASSPGRSTRNALVSSYFLRVYEGRGTEDVSPSDGHGYGKKPVAWNGVIGYIVGEDDFPPTWTPSPTITQPVHV